MGMPCAHTLLEIIQRDGVVTLDMYDKHWRLATADELGLQVQLDILQCQVSDDSSDENEALEYIRNPPPPPPKDTSRYKHVQRVYETGRRPPKVTQSQMSTQRDPSGFEYAEGVANRPRRCGQCQKTGHNKRTCPQVRTQASQVLLGHEEV